MKNASMKPVDVGAPQLIPQGNLDVNNPGTFAGMRKVLDAKQRSFVSRTSAHPTFSPGYTGGGLESLSGDWQSSTLK
jgi:hypothetical protein